VRQRLPASAKARISAKVWPVPAKSLSACAGLMVTPKPAPLSSRSSAKVIRNLEPRQRRARPGNVHASRIGNRAGPRHTLPLQVRRPVRRQTGNANISAAGSEGGPPPIYTAIFPAHIQAREIVILRLRDSQAVAHKLERRFQRGKRIHSHAYGGVFPQLQREPLVRRAPAPAQDPLSSTCRVSNFTGCM